MNPVDISGGGRTALTAAKVSYPMDISGDRAGTALTAGMLSLFVPQSSAIIDGTLQNATAGSVPSSSQREFTDSQTRYLEAIARFNKDALQLGNLYHDHRSNLGKDLSRAGPAGPIGYAVNANVHGYHVNKLPGQRSQFDEYPPKNALYPLQEDRFALPFGGDLASRQLVDVPGPSDGQRSSNYLLYGSGYGARSPGMDPHRQSLSAYKEILDRNSRLYTGEFSPSRGPGDTFGHEYGGFDRDSGLLVNRVLESLQYEKDADTAGKEDLKRRHLLGDGRDTFPAEPGLKRHRKETDLHDFLGRHRLLERCYEPRADAPILDRDMDDYYYKRDRPSDRAIERDYYYQAKSFPNRSIGRHHLLEQSYEPRNTMQQDGYHLDRDSEREYYHAGEAFSAQNFGTDCLPERSYRPKTSFPAWDREGRTLIKDTEKDHQYTRDREQEYYHPAEAFSSQNFERDYFVDQSVKPSTYESVYHRNRDKDCYSNRHRDRDEEYCHRDRNIDAEYNHRLEFERKYSRLQHGSPAWLRDSSYMASDGCGLKEDLDGFYDDDYDEGYYHEACHFEDLENEKYSYKRPDRFHKFSGIVGEKAGFRNDKGMHSNGLQVDEAMKVKPLEEMGMLELPEDSEGFKQQVQRAYHRFLKSLNENPVRRKRYEDQGSTGSLFCAVCNRLSGPFVDTHALVMHAYNSQKSAGRVEHLGFYKALCTLMGWSSMIEPDDMKAYQKISLEEAKANKEDLILWPPTVVIHNTCTGKNANGQHEGIGNPEMDELLRELGHTSGKSKAIYGRKGHTGTTIVKYIPTLSGLNEAERLHQHFQANGRGRDQWLCIQPNLKEPDVDEDPDVVRTDGTTNERRRVLYGYLALAGDLDKVDLETRRRCLVRCKKDLEISSDALIESKEV